MRAFAAIIGTMAVLALFAALATALGFFWGLGAELAGLLV